MERTDGWQRLCFISVKVCMIHKGLGIAFARANMGCMAGICTGQQQDGLFRDHVGKTLHLAMSNQISGACFPGSREVIPLIVECHQNH